MVIESSEIGGGLGVGSAWATFLARTLALLLLLMVLYRAWWGSSAYRRGCRRGPSGAQYSGVSNAWRTFPPM